MILQSLPIRDQLNVEGVCSKWNRLVRENDTEIESVASRLSYHSYWSSDGYRIHREEGIELEKTSNPSYKINIIIDHGGFQIKFSENSENYVNLTRSTTLKKETQLQVSKETIKKIFRIVILEKKLENLKQKAIEELAGLWQGFIREEKEGVIANLYCHQGFDQVDEIKMLHIPSSEIMVHSDGKIYKCDIPLRAPKIKLPSKVTKIIERISLAINIIKKKTDETNNDLRKIEDALRT